MNSAIQDNTEALTNVSEKLNLTLEDKFKTEDPRSFAEAKKISTTFSTPLLNFYLVLNLDSEEIISLFQTYYSEIFDVQLNVCKNPVEHKEDFQLSVLDALVSASLYFTDLKAKIETNPTEGKKEGVTLLYNVIKYISYKYQCIELAFVGFIKDFVKVKLREFIGIIEVELSASDPSQPEQRPRVLQGILDTLCKEAFDLIQKEMSLDSIDKAQPVDKFYYELAELLLHYARPENPQGDSSKSLQQKLIDEPLQKQLAKISIENPNPTFSELAQYLKQSTDLPLLQNLSLTVFDIDEGRMVPLSSEKTPNAMSLNKLGVLTEVDLAYSPTFSPEINKLVTSSRNEIQYYSVEAGPAPSIDKSKWMEHIFDSIKSKTLAQIMIPGSHDAGTFNMTQFFLRPWSSCQDKNFLQQLRGGVRYLDCRLVYYSKNTTDNFWFAHDACDSNTKLQDLLDDMKTFLESTSKEIVILDFSHFKGRDANMDDSILDKFAERFSSFSSYIAETNFAEKTVEELVDKNQRLILLSDQAYLNSSFGKSINNSFWANTPRIGKLSSELNREVSNQLDYQLMHGKDLNLIQAILTPGFDIVALASALVKPGGGDITALDFLKLLTRSPIADLFNMVSSTTLGDLAKLVAGWAPDIYKKSDWLNKVNIIFSDYACDNPFVDIAIHANQNVRNSI